MARGTNGFPYDSSAYPRVSFNNIEEQYNNLQIYMNNHPEIITTTPIYYVEPGTRFEITVPKDDCIYHYNFIMDDGERVIYVLPNGERIDSDCWNWRTDDNIERLIAISKLKDLPGNVLYGLSEDEIYDYIDSLD